MSRGEKERISQFTKDYPGFCEGKSDAHMLLCLKFIDAARQIIKEEAKRSLVKKSLCS